jgi:hypothetical protein
MTLADWNLLGQTLSQLHGLGLLNPSNSLLVSQGTIDYYQSLSQSVPEPSMVGWFALTSLTMLRRRRVRRGAASRGVSRQGRGLTRF